MDKNAIKKYAVWARRELISRVTQKALRYGITEKEIQPADASSVNGVVLSAKEKKQRQALIAKINTEDFEQVMEEVAYTWFNRFSALRFMEINGYLPTHVRVFTDEENSFKPQILAEAINLEIDGLDMEKVYALKEANDNDALFKYLIITQCNALSAILPGMFQKIDDYTELLFPDNLLREGSAIEQMVTMIPEEDWQDAVQIIGWLYQYYNIEQNDLVYDGTMSKSRLPRELIPAATTIFTPDWAVRYMVENSLGRLWLEGHPNDELKFKWKYYLEEAEQELDVQVQLAKIRKEYEGLKPEDIRCIDPCSGSGHILAYLFDVLIQIYECYGYTTREAVACIVKNNIYGLDINDRAAQLANFSIMMKARQYDRRFFSRGIQPHVYAIVESNHVDSHTVDYFASGNVKLEKAIRAIIHELHDAKEYGSILTMTVQDWSAIYTRFDEIREDIHISREAALNELLPLVHVAQALAQNYDIVVTNPPYLGSSRFSTQLDKYVKEKYIDEKSDLSMAMFRKAMCNFSKKNGFIAFITTTSWMFLSSFEKTRRFMLENFCVDSIVDFGTELFEGKVGHNPIISWVNRNSKIDKKNVAIRLVDYCYSRRDEKEQEFFNPQNRYESMQDKYTKIPGAPIAYWWSNFSIFDYPKIKEYYESAGRNKTHGNEKYVRNWWEISDTARWQPYANGGDFRRWSGNDLDLVDWSCNAKELYASHGGLYNQKYAGRQGVCWNLITSYKNGFRIKHYKHHYSSAAPTIMALEKSHDDYLLAFLNGIVAEKLLKMYNPTLNTTVGDVLGLPFIIKDEEQIIPISKIQQALSQDDWDFFETSWDFKKHPMVCLSNRIWETTAIGASMSHYYVTRAEASCPLELCFMLWQGECTERFNQLKANEEELNRIFIDIYGLHDELTPEVEDKDVTVRKADLQRDIKSLISYAVGCMFGRYSLDEIGLAYVGGEWDASKYKTFPADKDNIISICNDEYFSDDVVSRFVKFIEEVYGKRALESNLKFIAETLGGKGQPREVIRNYFINDFYSDHLKIYQKRPIYWLFDSGKKNGFKALIYMHRYQPDTIARMRTDYVHEQQSRYRTAIADLEKRIDGASTSERVKLNKQLATLQAQASEIHDYEEKIHHLADQYISIDLDDGVKVNYAKFQDVLAKIK